MRKNVTLLFCFLLLLCSSAFAQSKKKRIEAIMKTYHRFNMFDGTVLVAEEGRIIYQGAFGLANREWNIPNTLDTKFMIGSVSKPITSVLTLIQVQKGLLNLEKPISDYLPEFSKKNGSRITIRQLMNHTSGMPNYDIIKDFFPSVSRKYFERDDYMKLYMDSALLFEPGTSYYYSSWGYFTLGHILEKVTGKTYGQLMKDDIFDKIGMTGSGSYHHTQIVSDRATGYDYIPGGYASADFRDQSNTMGTGDLYSTVGDLFKLHLALQENKLLDKGLTEKMFTPGLRPWRYGLGWFNQQFRYTPTDSVFANYHLGMTEGFLSFIVRIPSTNSLVVFLCNSSPTQFFNIASNLLRVLYNKPVDIKQPVHKVMETLLSKRDGKIAVEEYFRMKNDTANFYIDWLAMYQLGNQLLSLKRYNDALPILENNVKEFPEKELMRFDLGRVYELVGRKEEAINCYKKALELNPGYEEAKSALKQSEQKN